LSTNRANYPTVSQCSAGVNLLFLLRESPTIRVDAPLSSESTRRVAVSLAIIMPRASREKRGRWIDVADLRTLPRRLSSTWATWATVDVLAMVHQRKQEQLRALGSRDRAPARQVNVAILTCSGTHGDTRVYTRRPHSMINIKYTVHILMLQCYSSQDTSTARRSVFIMVMEVKLLRVETSPFPSQSFEICDCKFQFAHT
jgi:hypothetical protein